VATPSATASRNANVVQPVQPPQFFPAAGAYALEPPPEQALLIASFELSAPAAVELVATANGLTTSTTLQLWPGLTLLEDPGVLLTIPGLLVNVAKAEYDAKAKSVSVTATVEMIAAARSRRSRGRRRPTRSRTGRRTPSPSAPRSTAPRRSRWRARTRTRSTRRSRCRLRRDARDSRDGPPAGGEQLRLRDVHADGIGRLAHSRVRGWLKSHPRWT